MAFPCLILVLNILDKQINVTKSMVMEWIQLLSCPAPEQATIYLYLEHKYM